MTEVLVSFRGIKYTFWKSLYIYSESCLLRNFIPFDHDHNLTNRSSWKMIFEWVFSFSTILFHLLNSTLLFNTAHLNRFSKRITKGKVMRRVLALALLTRDTVGRGGSGQWRWIGTPAKNTPKAKRDILSRCPDHLHCPDPPRLMVKVSCHSEILLLQKSEMTCALFCFIFSDDLICFYVSCELIAVWCI